MKIIIYNSNAGITFPLEDDTYLKLERAPVLNQIPDDKIELFKKQYKYIYEDFIKRNILVMSNDKDYTKDKQAEIKQDGAFIDGSSVGFGTSTIEDIKELAKKKEEQEQEELKFETLEELKTFAKDINISFASNITYKTLLKKVQQCQIQQ